MGGKGATGVDDGPEFWSERFCATEAEARRAARAVAARLERLGVSADRCGDLEIVTAEAVNNVVEHAYGPGAAGWMHLSLSRCGTTLCLVVRDGGRPLPEGNAPGALPADLSGPVDTLPEGGFGWFLIQNLCDSVDYRQAGGANCLTLRFGQVFGP